MSSNNPQHPQGVTKRKLYQSGNPIVQRLLDGLLQGIHELFFSVNPQRVLDVGCGIGHVMSTLRDAGARADFVAVELDADDAAIFRDRHPDVAIHTTALEKADLEPESFDLVMATEVLEHTVDPSIGLSTIARFSKGPLLLTVPWEPFFCLGNLLRGQNITRMGNDPEHFQHWTRRSFRRFVNDEGYTIQRDLARFPWQLVLAHKGQASGGETV